MAQKKISKTSRKSKLRDDYDLIIGPSAPWTPEELALLRKAMEESRKKKTT